MAGPCAERLVLDKPCKDIVMKAFRVRGRFSAICITCSCPRKGLPGVSTFIAWYRALTTTARRRASSCSRHTQTAIIQNAQTAHLWQVMHCTFDCMFMHMLLLICANMAMHAAHSGPQSCTATPRLTADIRGSGLICVGILCMLNMWRRAAIMRQTS